MSTWLKRNTSKKYVLPQEQESMDRILEGLLESQQPEQVKSAIIARICEQGAQPTHPPATVRGVFLVSYKWILHGSTNLEVASGFKLLQQWGCHHLTQFTAFFTTHLVSQTLVPGQANDANVPLLIREGFRVMNTAGAHMFHEHAQAVQSGVTRFVRGAGERVAVRNLTLLLSEFPECMPTSEAEVSAFCLDIVRHLSVGVPPQDGKEILRFIRQTDEVSQYLSMVWRLHPATLLSDCLAEIFRVISTPRDDATAAALENSEPAICLASLVKHVPIELANRVVKEAVMDSQVSETSLATAVDQMVEWLKWPTAQNVDLWIARFLTELAAGRRFTLLVHITQANVEQVAENMAYPQLRSASFCILSQMLLSFQHSPEPFHKALDKIPGVLASLRVEEPLRRDHWLPKISQLLHCLMYQHSGFPDIYEPVLDLIKDQPVPSQEEMKTLLKQKQWSSQVSGSSADQLDSLSSVVSSSLVSTVHQEKLEVGKTGLENLGNTCYMNSVLQALYMCDRFRQGILSKPPTGSENLLVKLQHVFAMQSQSLRPCTAPRNFLLSSRPPWFTPGHQQDCSEFLKYLLDQLHEDEKTAASGCRTIAKSPSSNSLSSNGTLKLSNGKSSKKGEVTLTSVKLKSEDNSAGDLSLKSTMSLIEKTFRGQVQTTLKCLACKQESQRVERFADIPLAFPNSSKSSDVPQKILAGGSGTPAPATATTPENSSQSGAPPSSSSTSSEVDGAESDGPEGSFTLNDLLSFYLKPEKLVGDNQYHCNGCGKLQDGERRIHIVESPQYLILTLLRFSYDTKLQTRTKIFEDVQYPRTLALPVHEVTPPPSPSSSTSSKDSFSSSSSNSKKQHSRGNSSVTSNNVITNNNNYNNNNVDEHKPQSSSRLEQILKQLAPKTDDEETSVHHCDLYGLCAVVVHSGTSSECGHYYCYARHSSAQQTDLKVLEKVNVDLNTLDLLPDKWYNFNDSRVSHSSFTSFSNVTKKFSKDTAYVLIYHKLTADGQDQSLSSDPPLRSDLRDAVVKDNEKYLKEQELEARAKEEQQRRRSASVGSASLHKWRDDDDDPPGGPPGFGGAFGGGGGGFDSMGPHFVF
ncbi:ubiquitin carboxyl-terminal hydrolase 35 [Aplysia californica]|uniref:Ubiquitin carboxyl-terminal hydrolase 35 n=1 Tax=Aplysia californica TaxID=6500 RepID=A0ABM0ZX40_APLCA|nr:ubiquitin carboxyl-terminal hydrolase 35 [Aplysia californica]